MSADWHCVGDAVVPESASAWLEANGLGKYAQKIIEVTDAESVDDLKLIDTSMVEDLIRDADIKLISAKKFRLAIAQLQGEIVPADIKAPEDATALASAKGYKLTPAPVAVAAAAPPAPLQECVVICIDRSGSMGTPFAEVTLNVVHGTTRSSVAERTRMEAVKAMFYAFRDRVESAGNGSQHLGLIQFDNVAEQMLDLTPQLYRFESIVDDMHIRGQTAIYSSILEAARMLEKRFAEDAQTDLRIIVLTDGQNNTGVSPEEALAAVNKIGAVVDAIIVGDTPDANLQRIVTATDGECYQITNLCEGFELLEAEGVVSLRARRGGAEKLPFKLREAVGFGSIAQKSMTRAGAVQRAPLLSSEFASRAVADISNIKDTNYATGGGASMKRILAELKQVGSGADGVWLHSDEGIHIFPALDSLNFWRVLIEGPPDSPFEGGVFALHVIIPGGYPFKPPQITFETPVYHCNVNDSGKICLEFLQDRWAPSLSVPKCLEAIRMMLKNPDTDNSLRQWIAELTLAHEKTNGVDTRYYDNARESTRQNANASMADWKQKWCC